MAGTVVDDAPSAVSASGVPAALGALTAAVDELSRLGSGSLLGLASPVALAELVRALEVQRRRLDAVEVDVVGVLSSVAVPAEFGATSLPDLVGGLTHATRSQARARVQRAVDLGPRRTVTGQALAPIHPRCAAALREGAISAAHVDVITHYLGRIPAHVANQPVKGGSGSVAGDEPVDGGSVEGGAGGAGGAGVGVGVGVWTVFDVAEAFLVQAARHEDPGALRRSGDLLLARLDPDGTEPRDAEQQRQRSFGFGRRGDPNGVFGTFTDENKAVWQAILDSLGAPHPAQDGSRDERSAAQRWHDGLLEAGLRLLRSGTLPESGGVPVTVVLRVQEPDLATAARGEPGAIGQTAHGDIISINRFLRLAGEADITTVVLTAHGGILDYGRTRRCAPPAQRRALTARDGGCCFPGCTRPAAWTEVHHIRAWIRGGRTDLNNLCLLCAYHHRIFEAAGWTVAMLNGVPHWTPPAWLDPTRQPRRNTAHHLPEIDFDVGVGAGP